MGCVYSKGANGEGAGDSRELVHASEDHDLCSQESSHRLHEMERFLSSHLTEPAGISLKNLIKHSMSFLRDSNKQTMKLRHAIWGDMQRDEDLLSLMKDILDLSITADGVVKTVGTRLGTLKDKLAELLDTAHQWSPPPHQKEVDNRILEKLRQCELSGSFADEFLQSFQELVENHKEIVEKIGLQETALKKKLTKTRWLRRVVFTIFLGLFAAALICSIVAAALHASPVMAGVISAAVSAASWGPFAIWVEELKERTQAHLKENLSVLQAGKNRLLIVDELQPIYSAVEKLKKRLRSYHAQNVHSTVQGSYGDLCQKELLLLKEKIVKESTKALLCIDDLIKEVERCGNRMDGRRKNLLDRMITEGANNLDASRVNSLLFY